MTSTESDDRGARPGTYPVRARLARALRRTAWSLGKAAALVALVGIALSAASALVSGPSGQPVAGRPADEWLDVRRPIPVFGLTGTDFAKLPLVYAARRHASGGGRRDLLTFGEPDGDAAWLELSLYRVGTEAGPKLALADELSSLAEGNGLEMAEAFAPTPLATRFGPFEASDIRLVSGHDATPCLGFRSRTDAGASLEIAGLMCGGAGRPVARDLLDCVIDRIDLLSAGEDTILQNLFVAAERRRGKACAPSPLAAAGARTTWLDATNNLPELKGFSRSTIAKW